MTVNPFSDFLKSVGKPRNALFIYDVDLAIQPSMSTETTAEQRQHMWDLYQATDGGVVFFTGRTHQSINKTFGHDYAGVFEHYSIARFGHGQGHVFMAPKIDIEKIGTLAAKGIVDSGKMRLAETPSDIRASQDLAVFIEKKNASVALVHTLSNGSDSDKADHLAKTRLVLEPVADAIIKSMGLSDTHVRKTGGDAVEIVPKGMAKNSEAKFHLPPNEIKRIHEYGLGKDTAVHNFQPLFPDRRVIITGDSDPDLKAMVVGKDHYDGKGVYVSNGNPLKDMYKKAVDYNIDHHTLTWPMIMDTSKTLRASLPQAQMPLPKEGGMVPNLRDLK